MMLYRFEVDYTVPGKMGSKNYVTAVAATDAAHARVEAGKIFEGLKEDYGYDKAPPCVLMLGKILPFDTGKGHLGRVPCFFFQIRKRLRISSSSRSPFHPRLP